MELYCFKRRKNQSRFINNEVMTEQLNIHNKKGSIPIYMGPIGNYTELNAKKIIKIGSQLAKKSGNTYRHTPKKKKKKKKKISQIENLLLF